MTNIKTQRPIFKELSVNPDDIVYTHDDVVKDIVSFFPIKGKCLDPCKGDGVFLRYLPSSTEWCEIRQGRDFFDYSGRVDWIVGNPPYSIFFEFLNHSFNISNNVVYILPTNKVFQSFKIMDSIDNYGGIHTILVYGGGQRVGFPFGFSVGAFYFRKNFNFGTKIIFRRLICDGEIPITSHLNHSSVVPSDRQVSGKHERTTF